MHQADKSIYSEIKEECIQMKIVKGIILGISIVAIVASVMLYFAFPNPTSILADNGQVLKQDYRWIIHVLFSVGTGLFFSAIASMVIAMKKSSELYEGITIDVAAFLSGAVIFATKVCMYHFSNVSSVWPWEYLIMFIAISVLACLITIFSFKETADFADDNKNPAEIEKEDEGEPTSDTLIEANDDEKTVGKVWFKWLKPVIILVVFLLLVISINDDPLMLFSVLALSMIGSSVIGVGCAYFSEKEHYKHYKTTIIVSSVVIGLFSFGIKLFENLHLSAVHHFIIPELLCFPVMLTLTNVGIAVLIQMINRKQSSKQ